MPTSSPMGPNAAITIRRDDPESATISLNNDRPGESEIELAWQAPGCQSPDAFDQLASVFATFHHIKLIHEPEL